MMAGRRRGLSTSAALHSVVERLAFSDEFSRECLAIKVERSIHADAVVAGLEKIAAGRPAPVQRRFTSRTESIAYAVADWYRFDDATTLFIDPGPPWQKAWIESFIGRLRDEHLNGQPFDSLLEAQVLTELRRIDYDHDEFTGQPRLCDGQARITVGA